ncbi:protein ALP1-like [Ixodes scapularis]|uniref:protein ALP1-like n=1 Tax=Ixodes scapularis TaxID=6945 RepID=UPI001C390A5F|nr:protein ALP1-like [Ixodes scapularis]
MARYSVLGDNLLLNELTWPEIEAIYSVQSEPVPRRNIGQHGFVDVPNMDEWTFKRSFRFEKMDLEDLVAALTIPAEVKSAQRVRVPGYEALCMTLRRLAYPNRLCDLERTFGRHSSVISSVVSTVMAHIEYQFGHLLSDLTNHKWLDVPCLKKLSEAVHARGAPLKNCWGFIDGTARHICRPSVGQQEHFSGHKRHHVQKYQALMSANGIICQLDGPFNGRRHDAGILKDTALYDNLQAINHGERYVIYGDPAYPLRPLLLKPFGGSRLLPHEALFNKRMSTVRQAVEWGFGKVAADFAFVDFHKNQKMSRQRLGRMYKVATLLSNCHTCLYGSQVSNFFEVEAPALDDYLVPLSPDS